ncbi:helix-turn-helix transcriptional regulator [Azospirillum sp. YIM DDC1]|uniref:Helix-turn-helix transcriptional regulator n=1 Tax=Azospirillum aestuarii TaxID=2802052 RepID=A0ABS1I7M4_9PROT|nr:helix-turn-helix transcriptional regulator [Azospirillum aestuarii]MBK4722702.1 helix-turn-helix transcriptional regulator [Azospirillum aestuarii]
MTETVTIPRAEYDALTARLEDLEDILTAMQAHGGQPMPLEWAKRILEGESPVRVWREFRGLSLRGLAGKAGVSAGYLSEIEAGKKPGSVEAYKALAEALDTSVDWLVL